MGEKRRYMRFNVLMDAFSKGKSEKKLKVNNFSREGLGILSDEFIPEGENLEVEVMIPGDNIPVVVSGEVTWADKAAADKDLHRSGIKFKDIGNSDRTRLLHYIYGKWMLPKVDEQQ